MVSRNAEPGSFRDAWDYGWRALSALIRRWWLLYVLTTAFAIIVESSHLPYLSRTLPGLLLGIVAFMTAALYVGGPLPRTSKVAAGITLTYLLPAVAAALIFGLFHILFVQSSPIVHSIIFFASLWIYLKCDGAACFFVLGHEWITPRTAYANAWRFVAGLSWWRFFWSAVFPGAIAGLALVPFVVIFGAGMHAIAFDEALLACAVMLTRVLYYCMILRLTSYAPALREREASQIGAE